MPGAFDYKPVSLTASNTMTQFFTASSNYVIPATGKYRIGVLGAGGSGGAIFRSANRGSASGGGGGGFAESEITLAIGTVLTVTIGSGGVAALSNVDGTGVNGTAGGTTSVLGGSVNIVVSGGGAGLFSVSANVAGGTGGTAYGGNIINAQGGAGGAATFTSGISNAGGGGSSGSPKGTGGAGGSANGTSLAAGGGGGIGGAGWSATVNGASASGGTSGAATSATVAGTGSRPQIAVDWLSVATNYFSGLVNPFRTLIGIGVTNTVNGFNGAGGFGQTTGNAGGALMCGGGGGCGGNSSSAIGGSSSYGGGGGGAMGELTSATSGAGGQGLVVIERIG